MTVGIAPRRAKPRWLTLLIAVAILSLLAATTVLANLSGSTFEGNDGNLVLNNSGNLDWANVSPRNGGVDKPSGSTDNSFGQGTKEDDPNVTVVTGSIPPNKNDLTRFYEASEQVGNGDIFLYLAWERAVNIGNANLDFEINKNTTTGFDTNTTGPVALNRSAGDLLITYDFGGSGTPTLGLLRWLTAAAGNTVSQCFSANALPCWGNRVNLTAAGDAEGAVNTGTISEPIAGGTLGTGLFGEASINLTAAGVFQSGVCTALGSTFLKSRSSSSFTAEIKDFIAPVPVSISNCGKITIHKVTENGNSTFGYTTTGMGGATASLQNGESKEFSPLQAGSYSVTENLTNAQATAGWTFKSLTCTVTGSGSSHSESGSTANITLGIGGTADCIYTNHINLSPTIATTLSATTVNIGDNVHDSATLSGATANAGGTVTYHAYAGANTCTGTDLLNSTKTVTNQVVPDSDPVSFNASGYYSFQAVYSGDANNNPATSVCSTEQLLVKANPSVSTTLSTTAIIVENSVHDSATLSGQTSDAGGTVTYTVYSDNSCSTFFADAGTKTVTNGSVPDSNTVTFNSVGTYYWQAVYSGDAKNNGATSVCTSEVVTVGPKSPSISTTLSATSVSIGTAVHDSSSLTGATANAGGTVTYTVYTDTACTTGAQSAGTKTVTNGIVPDSNPITFNSAGDFYWQAVYSGDANNNGATSVCSSEHLVVNKNSPSISTTLSATSVVVGSTVHDSSTLSGATAGAGGTVTYTVYTDSACTANPTDAGTKTVSNHLVPDSNGITFNAAGDYYWQAVYSGDANNNGSTSVCTSEHLVVNKASPGNSTAQNLLPNDSFTLSGGFNPTGSITFNLYSPSDATCSGTPALTQTVPVSGNGTYNTTNTTFLASAEGTWRWLSVYSGDGNNNGTTSACGVERFTIANS